MNPWPFTSAEKLDTQKGIMNNRAVVHLSGRGVFPLLTLNINATPIIVLTPADVIQMRHAGSKCKVIMVMYQIR